MTPDPIFLDEFTVICCLDGYVPESAPCVIEAVEAVHCSEVVGCVVKVMRTMAELDWSVN